MNKQACDNGRLDDFLRGDLKEKAESELIAHLDNCAVCRDSLQIRAGDNTAWREAKDMLTGWRMHQVFGEAAGSAVAAAEMDDTVLPDDSRKLDSQLSKVQGTLAPTDDPNMLGRLGPYEVSAVVGSGAMGVVLKAEDRSLDRVVAIKVMMPHLASSGSARQRFAREAKAAAAVLHPNVIAIHSVSNDEDLPYLVMPYLRGESLQKRLDREGQLPVSEVLRIGSQVAAGLAAAHAQGLVHRDIKPANILLEEGVERVAITDFGLARAVDDATMTRSGVIAGTPQYMSPEQARGEAIGASSDLFSLGSLLYTMCTGQPPFRAETTFGVLQRINGISPRSIRETNPDVPDWLCGIVRKLMSKKPADRVESADSVATLLEDCLAHAQQPDAIELPESVRAFSRRSDPPRNRFRNIVAILSCLAVFGLAAVIVADKPADISGIWTGEHWNTVDLKEVRAGVYEGACTFSKAALDGKQSESSSIRVKWSHIFNRYTGEVTKGKNRYCKISLRRVGDEVRGAWTASKAPAIDLAWTRLVADADDEALSRHYYDDNSRSVLPKTKVRAAPYWKQDFDSAQRAKVAIASDGRIAIATAVERQMYDPRRGVEGVSLQRVLELVEANRMGVTLAFDIDHSNPFGATRALVFSPDGKYLALGTDNGLLAVFDTQTRKRTQLLSTPLSIESAGEDDRSKAIERVSALAFSPDSRFLAACGARLNSKDGMAKKGFSNGDSGVRVWDLETGNVRYDLDDFCIANDVAFSPDGKRLVCSGSWMDRETQQTGFISLDASTGERPFQNITTANGGTHFLAISSNGQIVTGEDVLGNQNRTTVRRWTNRPSHHTVSGNASQADFTADGNLVAVLCNDTSVRFLDADSMRQIHEVTLDSGISWSDMSIGTHRDRFVVSGYSKAGFGKARVELWSCRTDEPDADASDD